MGLLVITSSFSGMTMTTDGPASNMRPLVSPRLGQDSNCSSIYTTEPDSYSFETHLPTRSKSFILPSPSPKSSISIDHDPTPRSPLSRQFSQPRPRRRSSQQRISLKGGRVSFVPAELSRPPTPTLLPPSLSRSGRSSPVIAPISVATSPALTPAVERDSFLDQKEVPNFIIEEEIGRGAYGLVKRARETREDGSLGPLLIIKQVIKARILADCWKKHPKYGTVPMEIYVMSAISSTPFVLPGPRPWDPTRSLPQGFSSPPTEYTWIEGKEIMGHPNICPLLDFFEDPHYYYLKFPSYTISSSSRDNSRPPPVDLFDLVENFPQGLSPDLIRNYLGQMADALSFLHSKGIVHRDIKDENVALGPEEGRCFMIDFGSSGLIKKSGWDTFSGTLDYAGPEILRGERYYGKEQDVWAFGVVAFVLLVGECPFNTAAEAQEGLESTFANASIALDERCGDGKEMDGEEADGGGALGDAAALVRACLSIELSSRPTFEKILECKFLKGQGGWGMTWE